MSQGVPTNENDTSNAFNTDTTMNEATTKLKRGSGDVGWDYVLLCDPKNIDKWKCLKCGGVYSGGIYRAKQHIANKKGNISPCPRSSDEDKKRCLDALEASKKKKKEKKQGDANLRSEVELSENPIMEEVDEIEEGGTKKAPRALGSMDRFVSSIKVDDDTLNESKRKRQQNINDALFKERTLQVHQYLARWVYESGIPFHAVDNDSFKRLVEAIGQFGPGYQPPSQYLLREPLLKGEVEKVKTSLKAQEEEWEKNGCSIMTDAWSDRTRRSIMNLCVNSRLGTTFLSSKEASLDAHTGEYIFEYVDDCIENLGEEKVVQVVTDNASNNMAAANMLLAKRPRIFWTPCATHSINLMLQSIGKISIFKNTIAKAKSFTIFVYSHHKTLALMRKRTKRNIIRPGVTRFTTAFLTLQSLMEKKEDLKQIVNSKEWEETKASKSPKGKAAYAIVVTPSFWNGVAMCLKVFTPLVKVLRLVDGDVKPAMGFVYGELKKVKEEIKEALKHKEERYKPILEIVDAKAKGRIDTPLHLTAYLLNPFYYYGISSTWSTDENALIMEGFFSCIERFYPDEDIQDKVANMELGMYTNKEGAFGRSMATKGCAKNDDTYDPVKWWSNYGISTPNLQKLAKKILSLTTSSSGCERNWSVFEGIHTKKRNRLDTDRMNKLVYVQFNTRLMNKKKKSKKDDVLLANEATYAQSWMVDGVDDDEDEEVGTTFVSRLSNERRKSVPLEEVREVDEDDFLSDGSEGEVDYDDEFDFDDSNMEHEVNLQDYVNEEMED